jgi:hypothetical protein
MSVKVGLYGFYASKVTFVSSEGMKMIGYLLLSFPADQEVPYTNREIEVKLKFEGTTFSAEATYL